MAARKRNPPECLGRQVRLNGGIAHVKTVSHHGKRQCQVKSLRVVTVDGFLNRCGQDAPRRARLSARSLRDLLMAQK
jgi:hypothetical protein